MPRILFVFTSAAKNLAGGDAGWYLPEAAHPYYILAPHFEIDFASPLGPNPPLVAESVSSYQDDAVAMKFLNDAEVQKKLASAKTLEDVKAADYVAVFYPGGHGPMMDLATDAVNIKLANDFNRSGKVLGAVCHGQGAIVGVTGADGKSIFAGRVVTSFTNVEEDKIQGKNLIPFSLENRIVELGGKFEGADVFAANVRVDGPLITGQNPASADGVGQAFLKALQV
ncbi:ThiJ/PfpI [Exidia glandulosa HHB12029]|uniref:D-lactate dehydratase n=1 Tax=Exidia glandulosa HHB12029 TaxID=1314781 RepID=A0A165EBB0_EXIGL|nr:ThiJ/PfpI [Exidia glandulosa HHB12029]